MILDKRIKSQGFNEEEHDFIIGTHMGSIILVQHLLYEDTDIQNQVFSLTS